MTTKKKQAQAQVEAIKEKVKAQPKKRARSAGTVAPKVADYAQSLKDTVAILRSGWFGARELVEKLNVSYQTPYSRVKQLRELGFKVKERRDRSLRGSLTRWHIPENGGDVDIIDGML